MVTVRHWRPDQVLGLYIFNTSTQAHKKTREWISVSSEVRRFSVDGDGCLVLVVMFEIPEVTQTLWSLTAHKLEGTTLTIRLNRQGTNGKRRITMVTRARREPWKTPHVSIIGVIPWKCSLALFLLPSSSSSAN